MSPIVGYRVWRWGAAGLESLNREPWLPGRPLAAGCRAAARRPVVSRAEAAYDAHEAPHSDCTCGVYATQNIEHLRNRSTASVRCRAPPLGHPCLIHKTNNAKN